MTTTSPPPPRCASCGSQPTAEVRVKDSSRWFYYTVSAATPTEKRRAQLLYHEADEPRADDASDSYVWSVGSSEPMRTRAIAGNLQDNILSRVSTLRALWTEGYITEDEYERSVSVCVCVVLFCVAAAAAAAVCSASDAMRRQKTRNTHEMICAVSMLSVDGKGRSWTNSPSRRSRLRPV